MEPVIRKRIGFPAAGQRLWSQAKIIPEPTENEPSGRNKGGEQPRLEIPSLTAALKSSMYSLKVSLLWASEVNLEDSSS